MIVYQIRHKPTGLYFKPYKFQYSTEKNASNLKKVGRTYETVPVFELPWIVYKGEGLKTKPEDWELVSFELTEIDAKEYKPCPART